MLAFYQQFLAHLEGMHAEIGQVISGLPRPALDWSPGPEMNSLAVLVVHLTGAERYWIGDVIAAVPSGRDREAEFHVHSLDAAALQARLDDSLAYVRSVLDQLSLEDLAAERLSPRDGKTFTVGNVLLRVLKHTALHTGHIELTRQLVEGRREAWYSFTAADDE